MKRLALIMLLATVGLLLMVAPSFAFKCTVNATGINFGSYDVFAATPLDATGSVSVDCNIPSQNPNSPLAVSVTISPGNSGSFAQRQLQGPVSTLSYNLYTTPSYSTVWGDGSGSSQFPTTFLTRDTPLSATIYGRIPALQNVQPGAYNDLLIVTVAW